MEPEQIASYYEEGQGFWFGQERELADPRGYRPCGAASRRARTSAQLSSPAT